MTNPPFITQGYYHIYNRGVEKKDIFLDKRDHLRFLEALDFYRKSPQPMKLSDYRRGVIKYKRQESQIELVRIFVYCLMPNHFHLLISQLVEGGITQFLRKLSDSYARYFNTKYQRVGPLFQGSFKAKLIETDEYLLQLSKYIHRNAFLLKKWEGKKQTYPYSSYNFYLTQEKHPFCDLEFISSYFSKNNPNLSYQSFVEEEESSSLFFDTIDGGECVPIWNVGKYTQQLRKSYS